MEAVDSFLRIKAFVGIVPTISKPAVQNVWEFRPEISMRFASDGGKCVSFHNASYHITLLDLNDIKILPGFWHSLKCL